MLFIIKTAYLKLNCYCKQFKFLLFNFNYMFQEIFNKTSGDILSGLTEQFGLGQDQAKSAINLTKDNLISSIGKEAATGNMDGILKMLNMGSGAQSSPMFQNLVGDLSSSYISKLGVSPQIASQISNFILPKIIAAISGSKSGNLDKSDLMKMISQGAGSSLSDKAGDLLKGGLGNLFK